MNAKRTCVVLADAARARIFTVERKPGQGGRPAPALEERRDLINPERRLRDSEKLSDSRPGSRQATPAGPAHTVDDRRDARTDEVDRKFAVEVAREVGVVAREQDAGGILVVAPPRLLGKLRKAWMPASGVEVLYVGLELTSNTPAEALTRLTRAGYLEELA